MYMELGGLIKTMLFLMLMAIAIVAFISGQTCGCDEFPEEEMDATQRDNETTQKIPKRKPHPDDVGAKSLVDLLLD